MKRFFAKLFKALRLIDFDLLVRQQKRVPLKTELMDGEVAVVQDGGIQKWVCLNCPGGCGEMISLSLNPKRRPRWAILQDFWMRPTVTPSVHQQTLCGCHFWIRAGKIEWCPDGKPKSATEGGADFTPPAP